jgi:hypothetical protein
MSQTEDDAELVISNEEYFSDAEADEDESPKTDSEVEKGASDSPKTDSEVGKGASDSPKTDSEVEKGASDSTKTDSEVGKDASDSPKTDSELSKRSSEPSSSRDRRASSLSTSRGRARRFKTPQKGFPSKLLETTNRPNPDLFSGLEGTTRLNENIFTERVSPVHSNNIGPALQAPRFSHRPSNQSYVRHIGPALQAPRLADYRSSSNSHSFVQHIGPALQATRFGQVPQPILSSYRRPRLPLSDDNLHLNPVNYISNLLPCLILFCSLN